MRERCRRRWRPAPRENMQPGDAAVDFARFTGVGHHEGRAVQALVDHRPAAQDGGRGLAEGEDPRPQFGRGWRNSRVIDVDDGRPGRGQPAGERQLLGRDRLLAAELGDVCAADVEDHPTSGSAMAQSSAISPANPCPSRERDLVVATKTHEGKGQSFARVEIACAAVGTKTSR